MQNDRHGIKLSLIQETSWIKKELKGIEKWIKNMNQVIPLRENTNDQ